MKTVLAILLLVSAAIIIPDQSSAAWPIVHDVAFEQAADGTGQVHVTYNLHDDEGDVVAVSLRASLDGGVTWPVECTAVTGDVGSGVAPGTGKSVVWDILADLPGFTGDQLAIRVLADNGLPEPATFSNYVAIGNSLTAGYMDGGLCLPGQMDSYPRQIAAALGYGDEFFLQPLVALPGIGTTTPSSPYSVPGVLYWNGGGVLVLGETPVQHVADLLLAALFPLPYSNLGVPGMNTFDVLNRTASNDGQGAPNGYIDIVLRNADGDGLSVVDQVVFRGPTLVTCWVGANDIVGGATSGEPQVGVNVTPVPEFAATYEAMLDEISERITIDFGRSPSIVVANIPAVTATPYFIPRATFDQIMGFSFPCAEDATHVLLPALSYVGAGGTPPLPETYTLDAAEVDLIEGTVASYNQVISSLSAARGIPVYDAHSTFAGLSSAQTTYFPFLLSMGMDVAGAAATTEFSLDGLHPNNHGYALVASGFLETINQAFGTSYQVSGTPVWDPTYGRPVREDPSGGPPRFTDGAIDAVANLFNAGLAAKD
jgi:hypothetical protein